MTAPLDAAPPAGGVERWLLLRGLAREQRHWGAFPGLLASALGAEVGGIDLPGAGTENERRCPTTIRGIVDDTRARWLRDRAEGRWNLLGISLGGMVAMDWAAAYPSDFGRVVLVNTSAGNLAAPWERMDLAIVPQLVAAARSDDLARRERIVLGFTSRLAPDLDRVAETWAGYAKDRPLRVETLLRQIFAATRFRAPKSLGVRALVVAGARDPLAHPVCAERLAAHFHAPLAVHPGAGHDLPLDDGPWLAETVRSWRDG